MARESGLTHDDMLLMNIGDVLEYVYTWVDFHDNTEEKQQTRNATQEDIDRMFYNG